MIQIKLLPALLTALIWLSPAAGALAATQAGKEAPRVMLWSWQKVEDLRPIDVKKAGVALLVARFTVAGQKVNCEPRLSRLQLPSGCYLEAVARVEVASLPEQEHILPVAEQLAEAITRLTLCRHFDALQIDFDARHLERPFYLALLNKLGQKLAPELSLSTTALASWSQGDLWLKDAAEGQQSLIKIDHVVPMFFTMGAGRNKALQWLAEKPPSRFNNQLSIGLSITDPEAINIVTPSLNTYNRIYLFCSPGWSEKNLQKAGKLLNLQLIEGKFHGN